MQCLRCERLNERNLIWFIFRLQEADLGFNLIIDRRKDRWTSVKAVLLRISVSIANYDFLLYKICPKCDGFFGITLPFIWPSFIITFYRFFSNNTFFPLVIHTDSIFFKFSRTFRGLFMLSTSFVRPVSFKKPYLKLVQSSLKKILSFVSWFVRHWMIYSRMWNDHKWHLIWAEN